MESTKDARRCLIVTEDEKSAGRLVQQVRLTNFDAAVVLTTDEALKLMAFVNYDLIILDEAKVRKDKRLLAYMATIPMSLRRKSLFMLIGDTHQTGDGLNAFAMALNGLINTRDIPRLASHIQTIEKEHAQSYRVFQNIIG